MSLAAGKGSCEQTSVKSNGAFVAFGTEPLAGHGDNLSQPDADPSQANAVPCP